MNDHAHLFAFEDDFVASLRCIPMAVRFKLDLAEVKLSLREWSRFTAEDRQLLLLQPCQSAEEISIYRETLVALLAERAHAAARPLPPGSVVDWTEADATPDGVRDFAHRVGLEPPSDDDWRRLNPLQRFVLLKLSRDNHDNVNFVPALKEFGLGAKPQASLAPLAAANA